MLIEKCISHFKLVKIVVKTVIFIVSAFVTIIVARPVMAATLYFVPESGQVNFGDVFTVDVRLDVDNPSECINTVEAAIGFDRSYLEAVDFSSGDSILSLWLELPTSDDMAEANHQARLKFSGGIPGGYCGKIPGDPGDSNILGRLVFKASSYKAGANTQAAKLIFLDGTKALLNDGLGTETKLNLLEADFTIGAAAAEPKSDWQAQTAADNLPPEPFLLEIQQSDIYDGQYYLVWNTTDKQTGVDHYEILESEPEGAPVSWLDYLKRLFAREVTQPTWQTASTPYLLSDQSLGSIIRVKAVDKAGNERIAEYFPPEKKTSTFDRLTARLWPIALLSAVALVTLAIWLALRRLKNRRNLSP